MADERYIDVSGQVDTWYCVFSPHSPNIPLNRWMRAGTDPGCRHVYLLRRAGLGIMQLEATAFGAFCEYWEVSLARGLLKSKSRGDRVYEWGIEWSDDRMAGKLTVESLVLGKPQPLIRELDGIDPPVYIQPGYFSCVALVKSFMNIDAPTVQTPKELEGYLIGNGAQRI